MPRDGEVDYGAYTNAELVEAAAGINAKLVPENYRRLVEEMQARGIAASPVPAARTRSRTVRIVGCLVFAMIATDYLIFAYGTSRFSDGPISPCGEDRYCGKQGQAHSLEDYDAYVAWERALLLSGIAVVITLVIGGAAIARSREPDSGK